jgi:hypothetical protein
MGLVRDVNNGAICLYTLSWTDGLWVFIRLTNLSFNFYYAVFVLLKC